MWAADQHLGFRRRDDDDDDDDVVPAPPPPTETVLVEPAPMAERAEAIANAAFERWLPHANATQDMGTKICDELLAAQRPL